MADSPDMTPRESHGNGDGPRPQLQVERDTGWTPAKERLFLDALATTANVKLSLAKVGMSSAGLYKRRQRSPAFRRGWDEALSQGYALVEAMLLDRAINGVPKAKGSGDDGIIQYEPCSERVALALLNAHAKRVHEHRAAAQFVPENPEVARRQLIARLEALGRQMGIEIKP